jgi:hypothetical protein
VNGLRTVRRAAPSRSRCPSSRLSSRCTSSEETSSSEEGSPTCGGRRQLSSREPTQPCTRMPWQRWRAPRDGAPGWSVSPPMRARLSRWHGRGVQLGDDVVVDRQRTAWIARAGPRRRVPRRTARRGWIRTPGDRGDRTLDLAKVARAERFEQGVAGRVCCCGGLPGAGAAVDGAGAPQERGGGDGDGAHA